MGMGKNWTAGTVLRDRNAGLYLSGVVVSGFGTSAMWLAGGIWVKSLTGSDSLAALTVFAMWAPTLVGPVLGAIADRWRRRPLLVFCNLAMAALLPLLLLVDSADRVWILFAVLFVYGVSGVVQDAAEAALVATAIDKRLLGDFNGLRMTANEGMKLLAPLAGAGLYAAYGGASVALLDALTFTLAAGLFALMRVREEKPVRDRSAGGLAGTMEGVRVLRNSPAVGSLVLAGSVTMLLAGLNGAAIYAVVDSGLGHAPTYVGLLYALQGAGSVALGLLAGPLMRRMSERVFAAGGVALFAAAVGLRALPYDAVVLASSVAVGVGLPCVLIAAMTAVQRETPDAVLGRTAATANTLIYVPNAVALALGAGLIAFVDITVLLPVIGVLGLLTAAGLTFYGRPPREAPAEV
ncbi:MFS transporter [Streptomyces sp. NBC_01498]|uniref:MFS transporter n=1 Tax=Streptomyces sp. NBC_01498 TaxID=2975870 RepID=UPI002E7BEED8|nr:MFS transporter [Streptomyces sp. NBC_01498]WTL27487.1 MFS transporter [Streptomyces sp. NBC_01498]